MYTYKADARAHQHRPRLTGINIILTQDLGGSQRRRPFVLSIAFLAGSGKILAAPHGLDVIRPVPTRAFRDPLLGRISRRRVSYLDDRDDRR